MCGGISRDCSDKSEVLQTVVKILLRFRRDYSKAGYKNDLGESVSQKQEWVLF